jgi:bifunctional DNase/RNase
LRNQTANKSVFIDCRPSDGLAMASRLGSIAIVVNEGLLESCV